MKLEKPPIKHTFETFRINPEEELQIRIDEHNNIIFTFISAGPKGERSYCIVNGAVGKIMEAFLIWPKFRRIELSPVTITQNFVIDIGRSIRRKKETSTEALALLIVGFKKNLIPGTRRNKKR